MYNVSICMELFWTSSFKLCVLKKSFSREDDFIKTSGINPPYGYMPHRMAKKKEGLSKSQNTFYPGFYFTRS